MMDREAEKKFNVTGLCIPGRHYMVDTSARIETILCDYIDQGAYFTINRARQYGKTTTLALLTARMQEEYVVIRMSFEGRDSFFGSFPQFCYNIRLEFISRLERCGFDSLAAVWNEPADEHAPELYLRRKIAELCEKAGRPVVLMIDEVDRASDFSVFATFLGVLRDMYLERDENGAFAFLSVILAGVHDIKNLKKKIRPESAHSYNSPWNIAADFEIDMSFSATEIEAMLGGYENDHRTGMDIPEVAGRIYFYTNGYPFLVSRLCKTVDETLHDWSADGVDEAVKRLVVSENTLFDDMVKNIESNPPFAELLRNLLIGGEESLFQPYQPEISLGAMYGILSNRNGKAEISNLVFETVIYNYFAGIEEIRLAKERFMENSSLFIKDGRLDMDRLVERFADALNAEYRRRDEGFVEREFRLLFICFLRPVINGAGHYVVEAQTRDDRRMDVVVFYGADKFIVELKIWRGEKHEAEGMKQLAGYLDVQGQTKGWLISFHTGKKPPRKGGVFECEGKEIVETVIAIRNQ